jgi:predicted transcriptional regulator
VRRIQVTLDEESFRILDELAAPRAGNRSFVVREALRRMAEQETWERDLDWLETVPEVRASLKRGLADLKAGRVVEHAEVSRRLRRRGRSRGR